MKRNILAKVNFYRIEVLDTEKNEIVEENIGILFKSYIDKMNDSERFCKGGKCSAILSDYYINEETEKKDIPSNVSFDFSKFTQKKVNSAIIANPLQDTDTFNELNHRTIESTNYTSKEKEIVKNIFLKTNIYDEIIEQLRVTEIDPYKIYKLISDEKITILNQDEQLTFKEYYYENVLNRLQKDKTFFNFMKINDTNILSVLYNSEGFDHKKIIEYLNSHILVKNDYTLKHFNIYEDEFSEILDHSEMQTFEFSYNCDSKSLLDKNDFNSKIEAITDLFGSTTGHEIKVSVNAEKQHTLSNEKILNLFALLRDAGIIKSCKVKKKGSRNFVESTSVGDLLKYTSNYKYESLSDANFIFSDAYNKTLNTILDRIN